MTRILILKGPKLVGRNTLLWDNEENMPSNVPSTMPSGRTAASAPSSSRSEDCRRRARPLGDLHRARLVHLQRTAADPLRAVRGDRHRPVRVGGQRERTSLIDTVTASAVAVIAVVSP